MLLVIVTISEHTQHYGFMYTDSFKTHNILHDEH